MPESSESSPLSPRSRSSQAQARASDGQPSRNSRGRATTSGCFPAILVVSIVQLWRFAAMACERWQFRPMWPMPIRSRRRRPALKRSSDPSTYGSMSRWRRFLLRFRVSPRRPVTFFYNGGPGSSSVFLLLAIVRAPSNQDEHALLHAAGALHARGQPRQPDRPFRPRLHQSCGHRLFCGDRAEQEPGFLGCRRGRALDQTIRQALSDSVWPLELAEISIRRSPTARRAPAC